jgi:hypothetical protein
MSEGDRSEPLSSIVVRLLFANKITFKTCMSTHNTISGQIGCEECSQCQQYIFLQHGIRQCSTAIFEQGDSTASIIIHQISKNTQVPIDRMIHCCNELVLPTKQIGMKVVVFSLQNHFHTPPPVGLAVQSLSYRPAASEAARRRLVWGFCRISACFKILCNTHLH